MRVQLLPKSVVLKTSGVKSLNLYFEMVTYAVAGACGDTSMAFTIASPTSGGVTLLHVLPASRVSWTRPSSVPTHSVAASWGDSAMSSMTP